jgi:hypothetical protein
MIRTYAAHERISVKRAEEGSDDSTASRVGDAVLSLLTSAATVYAECAWVGWFSSTLKTGVTMITPIGASDSKAECQQRIADIRQGFDARMKEQNLVAFSVICPPTP